MFTYFHWFANGARISLKPCNSPLLIPIDNNCGVLWVLHWPTFASTCYFHGNCQRDYFFRIYKIKDDDQINYKWPMQKKKSYNLGLLFLGFTKVNAKERQCCNKA